MSGWAGPVGVSLAAVLLWAGLAGPAAAGTTAADPDSAGAAADSAARATTHAAADSLGGAVQPPGAARDSTRAQGLPIRSVRIEPRNIFEPLPPGHLRPFYHLANHLHVRTRARTIREQLLFGPGDVWDEEVGRETRRNLRALGYLFPDEVVAVPENDSVDVWVRTRDAWTTAVEFNIESSGGQRYGSVGVTERNLLGLGKSLAFSRRVEPSGVSRSIALGDPAVLGSRFGFHFEAGTGSGGAINRVSLGVPYYSLETPASYLVRWTRSTSVMQLYRGPQVAADLDERFEETEVQWGRGRYQEGTVTRGLLSVLVRDRRLGPSRLLVTDAPPDFDGGEENLHLRRFAAELRIWHPHFLEMRDVDRMTGIEDFDVGAATSIKIGVAPRFLGSTANEAYANLTLNLGTETPLGFGWARGSLESRFRWTPIETLRKLNARWVTAPYARQRLILNVEGLSGERMARDFQMSIGGLNGLRAYPVRQLTGTRGWRLAAENRWVPRHTDTQLVALGAALFCDAGRVWGPGAAGTGWHTDAGVGLRLATPRTSMRDVVRFDVAFPLDPVPGGRRRAVFSFGSSQAF